MARLNIRKLVRREMTKQRISIPTMARRLELNPQTLYNYFAGRSELTAANLEGIIEQLNGKLTFDVGLDHRF